VNTQNNEFDAIVVGSGPGGATVARDLSRNGKRVLILERGGNAPLKDGLFSAAKVLNTVRVSDNLSMGRAFTTGGTTSVYLAVADPPPLETYASLGIDLSGAYEEAKRDLPLAVMPDELLRPHSLRIRESATALGYPWWQGMMLVDQKKCASGYNYDAKWTARTFVDDARANGATLINRARVTKVLVENGRAVGVEYQVPKSKKETESRRAYAAKTILAAGGAATPILLRNSGIRNVADKGFYCHPNFMVFGTIAGLKGGDGYGGTEGTVIDDVIHVGDGNFARTIYRMIMLGSGKWVRALLHKNTIGVGVMVTESIGGGLQDDNRYYKQLTKDDHAKLSKGENAARRILERAGAKNLFRTDLSAAHLGGAVRITEHVDTNFETEYRDLHVCDGSIIPETGYGVQTPTLTLVCLGKYLVRQLCNTKSQS
jgi:hypothetical protein